MDATERMIRQEVARYRGVRGINLMKSLALILIGVLGCYVAWTGDLFNDMDPSAGLYKALGAEGVKLLAMGICVVALGIGIIWTINLIRDLGAGAKAYEQAIRDEIKRHAESAVISSH